MNPPAEQRALLRFLTAGSVDDGKSTLIGRLLYETGGVYVDQLHAVRKASMKVKGDIDLSLITDGLKAEREQAITIDVAYRYFSTAKRKFIIADTPGHEQYTRNMVTGASTADLAVLLVDVRKGLLEQTRRHAYVIWLLGIRHVVLAVNKMDLVEFTEQPFLDIQIAFAESTAFMHGITRYSIPLSALAGENVGHRSRHMPWYAGPSLLELLETVVIQADGILQDFRFPVQSVIRPDPDFRGYAGQIVSGAVRPGQEVMALPSGRRSKVERILLHKHVMGQAVASQSVLLTLSDHIDLGRGDMLVDPERMPVVANRFTAQLIWMSERRLKRNTPYLIRHVTQILCCSIRQVLQRVDMASFERAEADTLRMNEIGLVEVETHKPMFFDSYSANRAMGGFIVIDPADNETVAAGLVSEYAPRAQEWIQLGAISQRGGADSTGLTVWFTGLSGAGKTTICSAVFTELLAQGFKVEVLDGDTVRKSLNNDLGFSRKDRDENVKRIGFVAQLLARHGVIVLVAAISPYRSSREELRTMIPNFMEVYVNAPLLVCEQRDPKGLYKRARKKEILGFTGIDDPYEPPLAPEVECMTDRETVKASTSRVVSAVLAFFSALATKGESRRGASFPTESHAIDSSGLLPHSGTVDPFDSQP